MPRDEVETEGRTELINWLKSQDHGVQAALAKRLGVTPQLVSQWVSGDCRPGQIYRDALEGVTGIDPRKWETASERARRLRALRGPDDEPESEPKPKTGPKLPPAGSKAS